MPDLVQGEGPSPCRYLILGEAPGAEEERLGRPFVGRSGALLEEALSRAGKRREGVFITNCYKHRPPENCTPTRAELDLHRELLEQDFRDVQPLEVLTLGNVALHALRPDAGGITRVRGEWLTGGDWAFRILPTYHPAYILRNNNEKETFIADVQRFFDST